MQNTSHGVRNAFRFLGVCFLGSSLLFSDVQAGGTLYDISPDLVVTELTAEVVKNNPMAVMFMKKPPWEDRKKVLELMQHNVELYTYMPVALREDPEIRKSALALGLPAGVRLTADMPARVRPSKSAPLAFGGSDTTNGYLVDKRPQITFSKGDVAPVLKKTVVDGQEWVQVSEGRVTSREEDKEAYQMMSNVGGIKFEDFSFSMDPGWIPASATESVVYSPRAVTDVRTFEGAQNGDLAVYVGFDGVDFEGFSENNYTLLSRSEKGLLHSGDRVRLVWLESMVATEHPELVWLPFPGVWKTD